MERHFSERMDRVTASAIRQIMKFMADPNVISLGGGNPAPESFPVDVIKEITDDLLTKYPGQILQYGITMGYDELRKAYLDHLVRPKGLDAELENVMALTGSTQGIYLVLDLFIDKGDAILVENPTFLGTTNVMKKLGAKLIPMEMDEEGIIVDTLEEKIKTHKPKLLYTIPNFQNPTGRTLSLERRKRIAELAEEYNIIVLEDDPYGDVRMRGVALPPIKTFDRVGNVIMMNSFSKIISPGMRVGAVTAAPDIIRKMEMVKQGADVNTPTLNQAICAEFLNRGLLPGHLKYISSIYGERLDTMLSGLEKYFPAGTEFTRPDGGLFVWVRIPGLKDSTALLEESVNKYKVAFVPGSPFCVDPADGMDSLRLNFSMSNSEKIDTALQRLGALISEKMA